MDVYDEDVNERDENLSRSNLPIDEARQYATELIKRKDFIVVDVKDEA